jgi:hypothetical protein
MVLRRKNKERIAARKAKNVMFYGVFRQMLVLLLRVSDQHLKGFSDKFELI